jgi:hypothetical protein
MSISAVLSGSGVGKTQWVTLTHTADVGGKKDVLVSAGELQVDLSFRKLAEIENEKKSVKDRLARQKQGAQLSRSSSNAGLVVTSGLSPRLETQAEAAEKQLALAPSPSASSDAVAAAHAKAAALEKSLQQSRLEAEDAQKRLMDAANQGELAQQENDRMAQELAALKALLEASSVAAVAEDVAPASVESATTAAAEMASLQQSNSRLEARALEEAKNAKRVMEEKMAAEASRVQAEKDKQALEQQLAEQAEQMAALKADRDKAVAMQKKLQQQAVEAPAPKNSSIHGKSTGSKGKKAAGGGGKEAVSLRQSQEAAGKQGEDPLPHIKDGSEGNTNPMLLSGHSLGGSGSLGQGQGRTSTSTPDLIHADGDNANSNKKQQPQLSATAPVVVSTMQAHPPPHEQSSSSSSRAASGGGPGSPSRQIDWNEVALPEGWDRRFDSGTNMPYYVDHVNKKTQWKHPLYKRK